VLTFLLQANEAKCVSCERNTFGQHVEYGINSHMMICSDKARLLGPVCSVFEAGNFNVMRLIF